MFNIFLRHLLKNLVVGESEDAWSQPCCRWRWPESWSASSAVPITGINCKSKKSQNVWPKLIRWLTNNQSSVSKKVFFVGRPRNFENVTLVAHRREHFQEFLAICVVAELPQTRGAWVHKNSLTRCQLVSSQRQATCSDVSFRTKQSCFVTVELTPHTNTHLRETFVFQSCLLSTVSVDLFPTIFDLTKGWLFDDFFIAVLYKLCRCITEY